MRAQKLKVRRVRAVLTASSDGSIFHSSPEIPLLVRLLPLLIYQMSCNKKIPVEVNCLLILFTLVKVRRKDR